MMKKNNKDGFTLLEVMIASAIFLIGILALYGMQLAAIKENLSANTITTGSNWASGKVEEVLNWNFSDFKDNNNDGCSGLDNATAGTADGHIPSSTVPPVYHIYWNIASNCTLSGIYEILPASALCVCQDYNPKYIRVIVTKENGSGRETQTAVFNYIKPNANCKENNPACESELN
ncbi:prepilin-type N-terminal cleavage/methylation domain-containing protein [Desulfobulbus sp. F4]|nr:prepilin-type N-terminal cleavage/methylation domain-containing protein [Desulfobulbus sp. F4]